MFCLRSQIVVQAVANQTVPAVFLREHDHTLVPTVHSYFLDCTHVAVVLVIEYGVHLVVGLQSNNYEHVHVAHRVLYINDRLIHIDQLAQMSQDHSIVNASATLLWLVY